MIIKVTRTLMIFAAVILLSSGMVVYGTTTLFTQDFPSQSFSIPVGSACSALTTNAGMSPEGLSTRLQFSCTSTSPPTAFTTLGPTTVSFTVTPTFNVPSGWVLGVDNNSLTTGCFGGLLQNLTSATPIKLAGGTSYFYCLSSDSASNFTSFSITWSM